MKKRKTKSKPKTFSALSKHEVYDRAAMLLNAWSENVEQHKVVKANGDLRRSAIAATDSMLAFYELAAELLSE